MILMGFPTGPFQGNCFIAGCEATKNAMIVDPGDEPAKILAALEQKDLTAKIIVVTHEHIDHIGAVEQVREATKAPVAMHPLAYEYTAYQSGTAMMWLGRSLPRMNEPEVWLEEGQEIKVGQLKFQVLYCPGHSPGHVCLYGEGVVFSGDVLFQLSIGRFDLPGGDGLELFRSIRDKLFPLPDETVVLPGHGPTTTIGQEKEHNPFMKYPRMYMGIDPE
ncbi:MAG: MBL fold metallo-hydrolase [Dehalococcoidia bacterium]